MTDQDSSRRRIDQRAIERNRTEESLCEREAWLHGQREALEAAVNGAPPQTSLGALARTAIGVLGLDLRTALDLADHEGKSLHHVVGMPTDYAQAVEGLPIGAESLACGLAVHTGRVVIASDVTKDARWEPWRWLAERFDYRGCWSFPIRASGAKSIGALEVYSRQPREPTQHDAALLDIVDRQVGHLVRLVDDLLEITRIDLGKIELRRERVDFAAVLRDVMETCQLLLDKKGHRVKLNVPSEPLWVFGDPVRLTQVAANLVRNAAKYTPPNGVIDVSITRDTDAAVLRIRDNGVGIPADMLARVFDPFTQVESSASLSEGGLGVGVAAMDEFTPELVFVDVGMPGVDGIETARLLRSSKLRQSFILVAPTGWGQKEDRRRTQEVGFDMHLTKPASLDAIEELLRQAASASGNRDS